MSAKTIEDIGLLRFGNDVQLVGAIYQGSDQSGKQYDFLLFFPGERPVHDVGGSSTDYTLVNVEDWKALIRQTDLLETEIIERAQDGKVTKAIIRKSARQIEQGVSWNVYRRDGYACRYCGKNDCPLTVDHLVTWEAGGPSIEENLLSSCKKCNKIRGNDSYQDWLGHSYYQKVSRNLTDVQRAENRAVLDTLNSIPLRVNRKGR